MGDKAGATEFFSHYTEVDEKTLKLREIVLAHKVPRRLELQVIYIFDLNLFCSQT